MILSFDRFVLNTETFELMADGVTRDVEPKVFDLLAHFARHPDQVFSRDELIEAVWRGRIVSDATVATCVKNARRALGDTGDTQQFVQTVRGRGYRFRANVSSADSAQATAALPGPGDHAADPAILILPLRCLSDRDELGRLAAWLPDALGTLLSRIPLLRISAEGNRYAGRDLPPTARQLHEECGVDFVLDGSLTDGAGAASCTVQLTDARTGYRLWAETFPLASEDQTRNESLLVAVIAKLEPQIHRAMYQAVGSLDGEPNARQLFLKASGLLVMQGWNHESFPPASDILDRACALDATLAVAPALQALLTGFGARIGLTANREAAQARAKDCAERALALDGMDSMVVSLAGCALADIGDHARGETLLRSAIDMNPANAQAWVALGAVRLVQHEFEDAVAKLVKGLSISPMDSRLSIWGALLSVAHLMNRDVPAAVGCAEEACRRHDRTYLPRIALAVAELAGDNAPSALRALADARRIKPDLTPTQIESVVGSRLTQSLLALETATS